MKRLQNEQSSLTFVQNLPDALKALADYYLKGDGQRLLQGFKPGAMPLFTGTGLGWGAAHYMAQISHLPAMRLSQLQQFVPGSFEQQTPIVIFGEAPIDELQRQFAGVRLFQINKEPPENTKFAWLPTFEAQEKPLEELRVVLWMSLAWLIARKVGGADEENGLNTLQGVRQRIQLMAEGGSAYFKRCQDLLKYSPRWILLGDNLQEESLRFAALMLAKNARMLVSWALYDDFEQFYLPLIDPDAAVIHFRSERESMIDMVLDRAEEQGAVVVDVVDGFFWPHRSEAMQKMTLEPALTPILNLMAGEMLSLSEQSLRAGN